MNRDMSTAAVFIVLLFVCVTTPCLLKQNAARSPSGVDDCVDDTISMFPSFNNSIVLSYDRSSCPNSMAITGTCQPHCALVLRKIIGCPPDAGDCALAAGHRHPSECTNSRFACGQFSALDLRRARDMCVKDATTVRQCSAPSCEPEKRRSASTYSIATGSCIGGGHDHDRLTIDPIRNPILPLKNVKFGDRDDDGLVEDGVMYARTYVTAEEIFEAMESSLFDPYLILFREFRPCLDALIHSSRRIVFLYLPEHGTLFEFGVTSSASNSSVTQTVSICTVAADDHRLVIVNVLMATGFGLSFGGLALTIVSVFLTGEHRSIPGTNLLCLSSSLIIAYLTVAVVKLARGIEEPCLPEGILHVVGILASLAWMNVMAFDIWNTLSKMYPAAEDELSIRRKLWRYGVYGWGLPVVVLVVGVLADHLPTVPLGLKPRFSLSQCWFYMGFNTWGTVLFYYGPIAVMMAFNLILFVLTARILLRSHQVQGASQLTDGLRIQKKIKYLFKLYVKLFLVMGLTWVLELTNLFLPAAPELFIFSDFVNTMQGFFIFVIFTCRIHVFKAFLYHCCPKRLSGLSKEDINQRQSRRFSTPQPSGTSRRSSLDPNSFQAVKIAVPVGSSRP